MLRAVISIARAGISEAEEPRTVASNVALCIRCGDVTAVLANDNTKLNCWSATSTSDPTFVVADYPLGDLHGTLAWGEVGSGGLQEEEWLCG